MPSTRIKSSYVVRSPSRSNSMPTRTVHGAARCRILVEPDSQVENWLSAARCPVGVAVSPTRSRSSRKVGSS